MTAIIGYRVLSQDDIDLVNKIKLHGQILNELVEEVRLHILGQYTALEALDDDDKARERRRLLDAQPERWVSLAKTSLQEGLMKLTRAVAQSGSF